MVNKINKISTIVITKNIKYKEVNDEKIDSDDAVKTHTLLKERTVIDMKESSTNEPLEIYMT